MLHEFHFNIASQFLPAKLEFLLRNDHFDDPVGWLHHWSAYLGIVQSNLS